MSEYLYITKEHDDDFGKEVYRAMRYNDSKPKDTKDYPKNPSRLGVFDMASLAWDYIEKYAKMSFKKPQYTALPSVIGNELNLASRACWLDAE